MKFFIACFITATLFMVSGVYALVYAHEPPTVVAFEGVPDPIKTTTLPTAIPDGFKMVRQEVESKFTCMEIPQPPIWTLKAIAPKYRRVTRDQEAQLRAAMEDLK